MKKIIRKGTFETNSSSSHSLVFCTEEEYKKLKEEKLFFKDRWDDEFITEEEYNKLLEEALKNAVEENNVSIDEAKQQIEEDYGGSVREYLKYEMDWDTDEFPATLEEWIGEYEYDEYHTEHKGEKIYALCAHGYEY